MPKSRRLISIRDISSYAHFSPYFINASIFSLSLIDDFSQMYNKFMKQICTILFTLQNIC